MEKNGCVACHTIDGKKSVGPSFKGIYGESSEVTSNGVTKKITVDKREIYELINAGVLDKRGYIVVPLSEKKWHNCFRTFN